MFTLSERLGWALNHAEKKAVDLAVHLKISKSAVSQWLSGSTKEITPKYLFRAAAFLRVEPEWLANGVGPRTPLERAVDEEMRHEAARVAEVARRLAVLPPAYVDALLPATGTGAKRR